MNQSSNKTIQTSVDSLEGDALTWGVCKALNLNVTIISNDQQFHEFIQKNSNDSIMGVESCFKDQNKTKESEGNPTILTKQADVSIQKLDFCHDWNQIGAILLAEEIDFDTNKARANYCVSRAVMTSKIRGPFGFERVSSFGRNIMESTMRVFVKSHFGEKIDVPNELFNSQSPNEIYTTPDVKSSLSCGANL